MSKTKFEINYEFARDRMTRKYLVEKNHLFRYPPCIVPAWEYCIDKAITAVEDWNLKNDDYRKVRFFQVKSKWSALVIYLEPFSGEYNPLAEVPKEIQEKIQKIAKEAEKYCLICGKVKTEIVKDTKIVLECFDHWGTPNKIRRI